MNNLLKKCEYSLDDNPDVSLKFIESLIVNTVDYMYAETSCFGIMNVD